MLLATFSPATMPAMVTHQIDDWPTDEWPNERQYREESLEDLNDYGYDFL